LGAFFWSRKHFKHALKKGYVSFLEGFLTPTGKVPRGLREDFLPPFFSHQRIQAGAIMILNKHNNYGIPKTIKK